MKTICGKCGGELTVSLGASSGADVVKLECKACYSKLNDLERVFTVIEEASKKHGHGNKSL